ncbi:hypothetical protein [Thalassovita sp.]|uniref:hypothetical protein n=1 Tax=Thalassovita sp. TaxID=1979401 RepID=UPI0029DE67E2|nr:hypothetical protein [Thalassovita sp.]
MSNLHEPFEIGASILWDESPPEHLEDKSSVAAGTRDGAQIGNEVNQLQLNNITSFKTGHPIIAKHWGIVE